MSDKFFPRLSSILTVDALPEQLGFIQDGISSIFDKLYFKNFQYVKSAKGDNAFYM